MTSAAKAQKNVELDQQVRSGRPLSVEALAHHLGVNRGKIAEISKKRCLTSDGNTFPWRRIWRAIYGIEGSDLAPHLAELQARHPNSKILSEIEDLEAVLRAPLIDFAEMALRRQRKPNTLSRRLKEGHETLPFPTISFGGRLRHFRPLEVALWIEADLILDLPEPPVWELETTPIPTHGTPSQSAEKAIFGSFAQDRRTSS